MQRPNHNTDTQPGVYPDPKVLGDVRESETAENRGPRLTAEMGFGEGAARPLPLATEHAGAGAPTAQKFYTTFCTWDVLL